MNGFETTRPPHPAITPTNTGSQHSTACVYGIIVGPPGVKNRFTYSFTVLFSFFLFYFLCILTIIWASGGGRSFLVHVRVRVSVCCRGSIGRFPRGTCLFVCLSVCLSGTFSPWAVDQLTTSQRQYCFK
jgi:hypothetical protein